MQQELTLSIVEAGRLLSAGRNLAYRMARTGVIPTIKLGRKLRVPRAALMRMLENPEAKRREE